MGGSLSPPRRRRTSRRSSARGLAEFAPRLIDLVADVAMNPTLAGRRARDSQAAAPAGRAAAEGVAAVRSRTASSGRRCSAIIRTRATAETRSLAAGDRSREDRGVPSATLPAEQRVPAGRRRRRSGGDVRRGREERSAAGRRATCRSRRLPPRRRSRAGTSISSSGRTASSRRSRSATSRSSASDPRWYELTLANTIYGGAFNSRIVRNIREEKGYTYSPGSVDHRLRRRRLLSVRRRRAQRSDRGNAHRSVQGNRQAAGGRQRRRGAAGRQGSTCAASSRFRPRPRAGSRNVLNNVYVFGLPKDYPETFAGKIAAVTPEQVKSGAETLLGSENSVIAIVGDYAKVKDQLAGVQGHHVPRRRRKKDVGAPVVE